MKIHNPNNLPLVDYRKVKPLQGNLKELSKENHDKLLKVLTKRGFTAPLFVWQKGDDLYLMDGHQRQKVMIDEDLQPYEVPYLLIEAENIRDAKAQLLEITSQYGTITQQGLDAYLEQAELPQAEVVGMVNFDALSFAEPDPEVEEDEPSEVDDKNPPISKLGEVYQLGKHRLMCGDSTDRESVEQLMNGQKADMVFTDPPYGVGYVGGAKKRDGLANDHSTQIYVDSLKQALRITHPNAAFYVWYSDNLSSEVHTIIQNTGLILRSVIVWVKNNATFSNFGIQYHVKHEPLAYCHKTGNTPHWNGVNNETTVWEEDRALKNEYHPTQKPVALASRAANNSCPPKGSVLDLFLGSGSTLIACEQTDRTCYGMELDPRYCDVIRKRYHKYVADSEEGWEQATPVVNKELSRNV
jgi:DNA modification methylase